MPKYWGKQIFALGSFPEVVQKQKTERKTKRKKERLNYGNNNGQLRNANATSGGARKAAWANKTLFLQSSSLKLDLEKFSDSYQHNLLVTVFERRNLLYVNIYSIKQDKIQ